MTSRWYGLLLVFVATALDAQTTVDRLSEIRSERANVLALLQMEEDACQHRFAVTDCVNAVNKRRRHALLPLQREETQILLQQRRERDRVRVPRVNAVQTSSGANSTPVDPSSSDSRLAEKMRTHQEQAKGRAIAKQARSPKTTVDVQAELSHREAYAKKLADSQKRQHERDLRMKSRTGQRAPLPLPP